MKTFTSIEHIEVLKQKKHQQLHTRSFKKIYKKNKPSFTERENITFMEMEATHNLLHHRLYLHRT